MRRASSHSNRIFSLNRGKLINWRIPGRDWSCFISFRVSQDCTGVKKRQQLPYTRHFSVIWFVISWGQLAGCLYHVLCKLTVLGVECIIILYFYFAIWMNEWMRQNLHFFFPFFDIHLRPFVIFRRSLWVSIDNSYLSWLPRLQSENLGPSRIPMNHWHLLT